MMIKTIVHATDGSAAADRALVMAAKAAVAFDARLLILTVSQPVDGGDLARFGAAEHATLGEILEVEARKLLVHATALARENGIGQSETRLQTGDPARTILDVAADSHADLIVVGKRGRGNLAGLLLGSVSQKLVSLAPCPVMVVP